MTASRRTSLLAALLLLSVTAVWGSTFFLIKDLLERVPTLDFLAVRFSIAAVLLVVVAPRALGRLSADARKHALVLGALYGVAQILQTAGLAHTAASVSGFITGMYVVATPLFAALILHSRITRMTWAAVALATAGLAVLTLEGFSVGYGEAITLVAALIYALHIVGLGAWSKPAEAIGMSIVQVIVIAVICLVASAPGGIVLPDDQGRLAVGALHGGVRRSRSRCSPRPGPRPTCAPTRCAIIMSMEPVFAALFAVLAGGEDPTLRMVVGGAMVVTAMLVVELVPRRKVEAEVPHIAV